MTENDYITSLSKNDGNNRVEYLTSKPKVNRRDLDFINMNLEASVNLTNQKNQKSDEFVKALEAEVESELIDIKE